MAAQPEIVVAIETNHEKLIERHISECPACLDVSFHFVILAARSREPICGNAALDAAVPAERSCEKCTYFSTRIRIECKSSLRNAHEAACNAGAESNRRSIRKERRSLCRYRDKIAKSPVRVFDANV